MADESFPRGRLLAMCDDMTVAFAGPRDGERVARVTRLLMDHANEVDAANRAEVEEAIEIVCAWWNELRPARKKEFAECYEYVIGFLDAASLE